MTGVTPLLDLIGKGYAYHSANPLYAHLPLVVT